MTFDLPLKNPSSSFSMDMTTANVVSFDMTDRDPGIVFNINFGGAPIVVILPGYYYAHQGSQWFKRSLMKIFR